MEVPLTPEQEERLAQIASVEGVRPERLAQGAVLRLIDDRARGLTAVEQRCVCPECGHVFQGNGFDGIDAHWRAKHEDVMPYETAWELIKTGRYDSQHWEDIEDLRIADERLMELRAGRGRTHSLDEVERDLGLAG